MSQKIYTILFQINIIGIIFLGGFGYFYLFKSHPYMGGYPDIAVYGQSTAQSILQEKLVSKSSKGGIYATELFPFLFTENTILTVLNSIHPMTNMWGLQILLPFLSGLFFYIIGKNLTGDEKIGILTAFLAGIVADLFILQEQAFSRFLSTYSASFLILLAFIAFWPIIAKRTSFFGLILYTLSLASGILFYHHHFGIFRFLFTGLCIILFLFFHHENFSKKKRVILIFVYFSPFFIFLLTNFNNIFLFLNRYLPQAIPNITTSYINSSVAPNQRFFEKFITNIPSSEILFSSPYFLFITLSGILGILFFLKKSLKKTPKLLFIATSAFLLIPILLHLILFVLHFVFPNRYLRELSILLMPFAAFFFWRITETLWKPIGIFILTLFLVNGSFAWFSLIFEFEQRFNTSWKNIALLEWARDNIPPHARILSDPFTLHVLQTSIPYVENSSLRIQQNTQEEQDYLRALQYPLIQLETSHTLYGKAFNDLCPEYIVIDSPQTSQFFNLPPYKNYYTHQKEFQVVFDQAGPKEQRIIVLKNIYQTCNEKKSFSS